MAQFAANEFRPLEGKTQEPHDGMAELLEPSEAV